MIENPPKFFLRFFRWYCHPKLVDHIEGDLIEVYRQRMKKSGRRKADVKFIIDVLLLFRPSIVKPIEGYRNLNHYGMLKSYFKIGWRNILRHKVYSFINIGGLTIGMAVALLIGLWSNDELSIDSFHKNSDRLYTVYETILSDGRLDASFSTPGLLAQELKLSIPDVQYACSYWMKSQSTFGVADKVFKMDGASAGEDFFKIFSFTLLQGTLENALTDPNSIAISRKMAESFFGNADGAIGKSIRYENSRDLMVSAVFEDIPENSSLKFEFLTTWKLRIEEVDWLKDWINRSPYTLIQLQPHSDPVQVEAKIKDFIRPYLGGKYGDGNHLELGLLPFNEMYLHATFSNGKPSGGRIEYVWLFGAVAVFTLLIACINFMNLSTAGSIKRSREIGVRKVVGAVRSALTGQFLIEAILLAFLAMLISLTLVALFLPSFNSLTEKQIILPISNIKFWMICIGLLLVTGLIAGSYPSFYLSSLNSIKVLKGPQKFSSRAAWFRKGLVVFQFALSIIMMSGALTISRQTKYLQTKSLGYDRENLIYLPFQGDLARKYQVFKQEVSQLPGVQAVTRATQRPSDIGSHVYDLDWDGKDPNVHVVSIHGAVDYDYFKMMKLQLAQGRIFSKEMDTPSPDDRTGEVVVINETLLKIIGYKDPIGRTINSFGTKQRIVGVVKDFHLRSLHEPIEPLILYFMNWQRWGNILIKTESGKTQEALAGIEKVFKQLEPKFLFSYGFVDEEYQKLYESEKIVAKLADSFTILAIFISCLGLFGLSMFTAEQRTKEIGIRKTLGASIAHILSMLSVDFVSLILLAIILAMPLAYFIMQNWLSAYAYHVDIEWLSFAIPTAIIIVIALLTISFQLAKAALANPVSSLKSD
jgi:putative ABC transport system permease protein